MPACTSSAYLTPTDYAARIRRLRLVVVRRQLYRQGLPDSKAAPEKTEMRCTYLDPGTSPSVQPGWCSGPAPEDFPEEYGWRKRNDPMQLFDFMVEREGLEPAETRYRSISY